MTETDAEGLLARFWRELGQLRTGGMTRRKKLIDPIVHILTRRRGVKQRQPWIGNLRDNCWLRNRLDNFWLRNRLDNFWLGNSLDNFWLVSLLATFEHCPAVRSKLPYPLCEFLKDPPLRIAMRVSDRALLLNRARQTDELDLAHQIDDSKNRPFAL